MNITLNINCNKTEITIKETPIGKLDGKNNIFTLSHRPIPGLEQLFLNGVLQSSDNADDYTLVGNQIIYRLPLTTMSAVGDKLKIIYTYIKE